MSAFEEINKKIFTDRTFIEKVIVWFCEYDQNEYPITRVSPEAEKASDQYTELSKQAIVQELADKLRNYAPVIQLGAVSQKWHVTLMDWTSEIHTGDTIQEALQAAIDFIKKDGGKK